MGDTKTSIEPLENLQQAYDGSWYAILGAGGDLTEWVDGYEKYLAEGEIGKPTGWYRTTGEQVNALATAKHGGLQHRDAFQSDLTILLFPLDGLEVGKLSLFKLKMQDRWFDDVIDNMRP